MSFLNRSAAPDHPFAPRLSPWAFIASNFPHSIAAVRISLGVLFLRPLPTTFGPDEGASQRRRPSSRMLILLVGVVPVLVALSTGKPAHGAFIDGALVYGVLLLSLLPLWIFAASLVVRRTVSRNRTIRGSSTIRVTAEIEPVEMRASSADVHQLVIAEKQTTVECCDKAGTVVWSSRFDSAVRLKTYKVPSRAAESEALQNWVAGSFAHQGRLTTTYSAAGRGYVRALLVGPNAVLTIS